MGRTLLDSNTTFDPETLQMLCRAFDEAWQDIAGNYGHMTVEEAHASGHDHPPAREQR